jgi:hypothetical protein
MYSIFPGGGAGIIVSFRCAGTAPAPATKSAGRRLRLQAVQIGCHSLDRVFRLGNQPFADFQLCFSSAYLRSQGGLAFKQERSPGGKPFVLPGPDAGERNQFGQPGELVGDVLSLSPESGQRILLFTSAPSKGFEFGFPCLDPFRRLLKLASKSCELSVAERQKINWSCIKNDDGQRLNNARRV